MAREEQDHERIGTSWMIAEMSLVKRQKTTDQVQISRQSGENNGNGIHGSLKDGIVLEPNLGGSILSGGFDPSGSMIATAGTDRAINLWSYGSFENISTIPGHKSAITSLAWSKRDDSVIFTSSADRTIGIWDLQTGKRLRNFKGHKLVANQLCAVNEYLVSCGDDGLLLLWDPREKSHVREFKTEYPLLTCVGNSTATTVYTSGIDPTVYALDLSNFDTPIWTAESHKDTVTSLSISEDDLTLISRSQDGTIRSYNSKSFVQNSRSRALPGVYDGSITQYDNLIRCKISNRYIISGGDDKHLTVWNVATRKLVRKLAGNSGSVIDVDFHPQDANIVLSTSSDGTCIVRSL